MLIEFALILPLLLLLVLAIIDFGYLIQTRLIITNVSREGGSIASRDLTLDPNLVDLLAISGRPLNLAGGDGQIFITRIVAGQSDQSPAPTITEQVSRGSLGVGTRYDAGASGLGLSGTLYDRLTFRTSNGTADIKEVTTVEVYYKYRPITPLANFIPGMLRDDGDGMIIGSRAIF
ncbi:MAG TPA: TadE/TadG family type IV pilus assembly protein [Candidatus Limnocylindria bacterium]|nr:TadE/TadG family type IV pilus assembly protein [Candidatus Limnocylindria bacterium]